MIVMSAPLSSRVDAYLATGKAECIHHGLHDRWVLRERSKNGGKPYRSLECKDCRKAHKADWDSRNPHYMRDWLRANPQVAQRRRTNVRGRCQLLVTAARARATQLGRECTITTDWLVEQWEAQAGTCAYTGWEFDLAAKARDHRAPSLDRFDSTGGYTPENTRLVCWGINRIKGDMAPADFKALCTAVANRMVT